MTGLAVLDALARLRRVSMLLASEVARALGSAFRLVQWGPGRLRCMRMAMR